MKRPLLLAGTGLLVFLCLLTTSENSLALPLFVLGIALCIISFLIRKFRIFRISAVLTLVLALAVFFTTGLIECRLKPQKMLYNKVLELEGIACDFSDKDWGNGSITVKNCSFFGIKTDAEVRLQLPDNFSCAYGDKIHGTITVLSSEKNLADFNSSTFLTARAKTDFKVVSSGKKSPIYLAKLCQRALAIKISEHMPPDSAAVARALLLGDKVELSREFRSDLSSAGASHIFAVSGMHLSLWSAIIFALLQKRSRSKILPNLGVSVFILFYMALTGFSPSVIRAGIMLITVALGFCFRKPADGLNSLGLSALILLTASPMTARDISFLLSYSSTAALLAVYPLYERRLTERHHKLPQYLNPKKYALTAVNAVVISLSVLLFTVPICSEYFGAVSLLSPVSSLLCTLPAEGVMVSSALALIFSFVPSVSRVLFLLCTSISELIMKTVTFLARFDFAYCKINALLTAGWYLFSAVLTGSVYFFGGRKKHKTLAMSLVCALLIFPLGALCNSIEAKQINIVVFSGAASGNILVYSDLGATAALICDCESTRGAYTVGTVTDVNKINDIDLLIVPTENTKTKKAADEFIGSYKVKNTIGSLFANGNGDFSCNIKNGTVYKNYPDYNCATVICNSVRLVFSFWGSTDFSSAPSELTSGDILLCRNTVPEGIEPENFGKLIVITENHELSLPHNAISTAENGTTNITIGTKEKSYVCY